MGRLSGKVALISGTARGIGKAIALRYADEGCNLVLCDLNLDGVNETAEEARAKGVEAITSKTDVTNRDQVQAMVDQGVAEFGEIHIIVNNAGIFFNSAFEETTDDQWNQMMNVNVYGVFLVSQLVIRHWLEKEIKGTIVNLASISAAIAFTDSSAYCASKAAVASMTRCIAYEYGPRGIRANSMAPGIINTSMLPDMDDANRWANEKIPMRRMGLPDDVADLAVFLGSDESRYITGDMIFVDGGWMLD